MDAAEVANFCNQYLISRVLLSLPCYSECMTDNKFEKHKQTAGKTHRKNKFEKPVNKKLNVEDQPQRMKKKKFEGMKTQRKEPCLQQSAARDIGNEGYVSIESLLNNFSERSNLRNLNSSNEEVYIGTRNYQNSSSRFQNQFSQSNFNTFSQDEFKNSNHSPEYLYKLKQKNRPINSSYLALNPSRSQYLYENESPMKRQDNRVMYVPVSRSPSACTLAYSNSCSNIMINNNKTEIRTANTRKKKTGERSFYLPSPSKEPVRVVPEKIYNRNLSSNSIIAKFEKQILEHRQEMDQNDFGCKSNASQTRYDSSLGKMKRKDQDEIECSRVTLKQNTREALTYLSEARVPPKPITIEIKK